MDKMGWEEGTKMGEGDEQGKGGGELWGIVGEEGEKGGDYGGEMEGEGR